MLNYIRCVFYAILLLLAILVSLANIIFLSTEDDLLTLTLFGFEGEGSILLYHPEYRMTAPVLTDAEFAQFAFSVDGRLAFASNRNPNIETYVIDVLGSDNSPVNISRNPLAGDFPLEWSLDGRYLAFNSHLADENLIYIWDGKTVFNITPAHLDGSARSYAVSWSFDGRLAFIIWYDTISSEGDQSEVFLWDGTTTTSLSQNPTGSDYYPTWSADGKLAFLSERNGEYDVFVWDGVSVQDGSPVIGTLTNMPRGLISYASYPRWTNDGRLAFSTTGPGDRQQQIYVWDGQTATNISQNPNLHNTAPTWNAEGRWAFVTFFSPLQVVYVRDVDNRTLLVAQGEYPPAWSSDGYLAFCRRGERGWILLMWDGQEIIEIARGWEIWAQWQSGSRVICSSG